MRPIGIPFLKQKVQLFFVPVNATTQFPDFRTSLKTLSR